MRLATLRVPGGTVAMRVDSGSSGTVIPEFSDLGALLADASWPDIASSASGPKVEFVPEDLAPVIPQPSKIICVGMNYAEHIREMGREAPQFPTLFIKFPEALIGPADSSVVPAFAQDACDFEGELACIIGRTAQNVEAAEAKDFIAGYSIMNDFTMRDMQTRTLQWHQGKSFEQTAGFGPWLDTEFQLGGELRTEVSGELMQCDSTSDLVFTPEILVEFISRIYALRPGDVIVTGTPSGVGHARQPRRYLRDGDVVRISIEGIGAISNPVKFLSR